MNEGKLEMSPCAPSDTVGPRTGEPASAAPSAHTETPPGDPNNSLPLATPLTCPERLPPGPGSGSARPSAPSLTDVTRLLLIKLKISTRSEGRTRQAVGPAAPRRDGEPSCSPPAASAPPGMSLLAGERPGSLLSPSPALRTASHPREGLPAAPDTQVRAHTSYDCVGRSLDKSRRCLPP